MAKKRTNMERIQQAGLLGRRPREIPESVIESVNSFSADEVDTVISIAVRLDLTPEQFEPGLIICKF